MTRTFDITPLRSLVAVASTGGVHRAAQSLLVTQSAVSQHLRKLEREAGVALVSRNGRRLVFTPHGEELLADARAILAAHDAASARFDKYSGSVVTIGAAQNSAGVILPMVMTRLRDGFADGEVRFHLDRNATVRSMLAADDVDIAVTSRIAPELGHRTDGFRLRWLWSATATMPDPQQPMPIVVFSPPCTLRQPSFDAFSANGRGWWVAAEVNDLATGLQSVSAGVGAMLVPVHDRLPDGVIEMPDAPVPSAVQLCVVYTDRTPPQARDIVTAALAEHVGAERVETIHNSALAWPGEPA